MAMKSMEAMNGKPCSCGKEHSCNVRVISGKDALDSLTDAVKSLGGSKVYILSDSNTFAAAGQKACRLLEKAGIPYVSHCYKQSQPIEPDEKNVGSAIMHYDSSCDVVLGVGSGVINDIGKIVSHVSGKPYIIVATAPSMDGYASASSSMTRDGLKISLPSRSADIIIGDTDVLCAAPLKMLISGLGDMIAKYTSICEWRIANEITGEYYCEEVANLIRSAVQSCVGNARGLLQRNPVAVQAVFDGLVIGGVAMNYAGVSRPASGVEHYISHVLDMRGVEYGIKVESHGIQCTVGTLIAVKLYEKLKNIVPDKEKAMAYVRAFDYDRWAQTLRSLLGKGAESMIALEAKEGKYNCAKHEKRLEIILEKWPRLLQIMNQELPAAEDLEALLDTIGAPKTLSQIGVDQALLPVIFCATKDIRDKYVLSRLCWDLGIIDEILQ